MCRGWAIDRFNIGDLSINFFSRSVGIVWQCDVFFTDVNLWHVFWRLSERLMIDSLCDYDQYLTQLWFKHGNLRTVWFNTVPSTDLSWGSLLRRFLGRCPGKSMYFIIMKCRYMIKYHQSSLWFSSPLLPFPCYCSSILFQNLSALLLDWLHVSILWTKSSSKHHQASPSMKRLGSHQASPRLA